ncbi:Uncharacterized protein YuaL [Bacillus cytotoxicus]|nr:Uncharacterized protein YuaL [Bacillus cytotoxicus]
MTTNLMVKALENAYYTWKPPKGLILHTDLGTQYTSQEFQTLLASYKIRPYIEGWYNRKRIHSSHWL